MSNLFLRRYRWAVDLPWRRLVAENEGTARHRLVGPMEIVDLLPHLHNERSGSTGIKRAALTTGLIRDCSGGALAARLPAEVPGRDLQQPGGRRGLVDPPASSREKMGTTLETVYGSVC